MTLSALKKNTKILRFWNEYVRQFFSNFPIVFNYAHEKMTEKIDEKNVSNKITD